MLPPPRVVAAETEIDIPVEELRQGVSTGVYSFVPVQVDTQILGAPAIQTRLGAEQAGELLVAGDPTRYGSVAPMLQGSHIRVAMEIVERRLPLATAVLSVGIPSPPDDGEMTVTVHLSKWTYLRVQARTEAIPSLLDYGKQVLVPAALYAAEHALASATQEEIDAHVRS